MGRAARRRRIILPIARRLVRLAPNLPVPISSYLDWKALVDTREDSRAVETRLVVDGYLHDPDFHPATRPLHELVTPTMFLIARRGPHPGL